jgi:hypothetical protein
MFNNLKNSEITNQLQMPNNEKKERNVKKHEKNPQKRIMSPDSG